jgi:hypothetical protein
MRIEKSRRMKDGSRHEGSVFQESEGEGVKEFQVGEVIPFCDNPFFFFRW